MEIIDKSDVRSKNYVEHNKTNTCDKCRKEGIKTELTPTNSYREYINGVKTGKWLCRKCYMIYDYHKRLDTHHNIIKSLRDHRTNNVDPNSDRAKGDRGEELTNRWRGVKNLNEELDCYNTPIDHSRDPELGIIQTKISYYSSIYQNWQFNVGSEHVNKDFDCVIGYCISENDKRVERVYIIPKKEIIKRKNITIYKNPSRGPSWYEEYRLKDEEELRKINDLWKQIIGD